MKAKCFHADLPYPEVSGLRQDKRQALLLMDGYSGATSEFSTVAQYAYHKIKCEKNNELYETLEGIMLVEVHHLELLGSCIIQLGIDPRYYMYMDQRPVIWQAEVVNYEKTAKEMIMADINGEKDAAAYYLKTADDIGNLKLAALMLRLAEDEKLHIEMFSELYRKYFSR